MDADERRLLRPPACAGTRRYPRAHYADRSERRTGLLTATSPDDLLATAAGNTTERGGRTPPPVASRAYVAKALSRTGARSPEYLRSDLRGAGASRRPRHPRHLRPNEQRLAVRPLPPFLTH